MTTFWWRVTRIIYWSSGGLGLVLFCLGIFGGYGGLDKQDAFRLFAAGVFFVGGPTMADSFVKERGGNFTGSRFALWLSGGWAGGSVASVIGALMFLQPFANNTKFNADIAVTLGIGVALGCVPLLLVLAGLYLVRGRIDA